MLENLLDRDLFAQKFLNQSTLNKEKDENLQLFAST